MSKCFACGKDMDHTHTHHHTTLTSTYKVAVFGDDSVGKSAVVLRMVTNQYVQDYPKVEEVHTKQTTVDDEAVLLNILDTAGSKSRAKHMHHVEAVDGVLLLFSVMSRESFDALEAIRSSLSEVVKKNTSFVLMATKCDMAHQRVVSEEEGRRFAQKMGCLYIETSARKDVNVDRAFGLLVKQIRITTRSLEKKPKRFFCHKLLQQWARRLLPVRSKTTMAVGPDCNLTFSEA